MAENYASDISVYQMVRDRLPFLTNTQENKDRVYRLIYELMQELEPCFRVAQQVDPPDPNRIGNEEYYSVIQRSIVADITAAYLMAIEAVKNTAGTDGSAVAATFIKKAKAGSAEVEYDQFDGKKNAMIMNASDTFNLYRKSAMRKAHNLGCIIDICEDCSIVVETIYSGSLKPFIVIPNTSGGGCGCGC